MSWLNDVKEHGADAYFWSIETAYQMNVIDSKEYRKRMHEYREIQHQERQKTLLKLLEISK